MHLLGVSAPVVLGVPPASSAQIVTVLGDIIEAEKSLLSR